VERCFTLKELGETTHFLEGNSPRRFHLVLDGTLHTAEIHWYEAHGLGRKEYKLKLPLTK